MVHESQKRGDPPAADSPPGDLRKGVARNNGQASAWLGGVGTETSDRRSYEWD